MKVTLKPIGEQVIVITGASSGIGLVTARTAARRGARVVLAARNEHDLARAVEDIDAAGGQATYVVTDVADERGMTQLADAARRAFGGFDTWVNNASTAMYGRLEQVSTEDARRLFDVNFWGVVHGCNAALPHLRERGGALINVGSALSDRAIPLQGMYVAAKHAVKGYTDTLRMELEKAGAPVSVSLVKPASIDTPFFEKARNYMEAEPQPTPPVYAPEIVAAAILHCAEHPTRDMFAGGAAKMISAMGLYAPRLTDVVMEKTQFDAQQSDRGSPARHRDNLYAPLDADGGERGQYEGRVIERSAYTAAARRPMTTRLAAVGLGLAMAAGVRALRGGRHGDDLQDDEGRGRPPRGPGRRAALATAPGIPDSAEGLSHVPAAEVRRVRRGR